MTSPYKGLSFLLLLSAYEHKYLSLFLRTINSKPVFQEFVSYMETRFPLEKLNGDLQSYLGLDDLLEVTVSSYRSDTDELKEIVIAKDDEIAIYDYQLNKRYLGKIFYPYMVKVIVGNYDNNEETGVTHLSKCIADMWYNGDCDLMTVNFYHGFA